MNSILFFLLEQKNEQTLYDIFVEKMQVSNDVFLRERLYGKV